jgi:hypothetical protein
VLRVQRVEAAKIQSQDHLTACSFMTCAAMCSDVALMLRVAS